MSILGHNIEDSTQTYLITKEEYDQIIRQRYNNQALQFHQDISKYLYDIFHSFDEKNRSQLLMTIRDHVVIEIRKYERIRDAQLPKTQENQTNGTTERPMHPPPYRTPN